MLSGPMLESESRCPSCDGETYHYSCCVIGFHGQIITREQRRQWQEAKRRRLDLAVALARANGD